MTNFRWFYISCDTFGGFKKLVDLDHMASLEDIVDYVKNELISTLTASYLVTLLNKVNNLTFHVHGVTFGEILLSNYDEIFYVCSHC